MYYVCVSLVELTGHSNEHSSQVVGDSNENVNTKRNANNGDTKDTPQHSDNKDTNDITELIAAVRENVSPILKDNSYLASWADDTWYCTPSTYFSSNSPSQLQH